MNSNSEQKPSPKRLRKDYDLYLIGSIDHQIVGAKLPSNRQVLSVYFYNTRILQMNASESANLVVEEVAVFYSKARIPTAIQRNNALKVERLVEEYKLVQKNSKRNSLTQTTKEREFVDKLDDLFDMSHRDSMELIRDDETREFLTAQRKKGRIGCLLGIAQKEQMKEDKRELRLQQEEARKAKALDESKLNGISRF